MELGDIWKSLNIDVIVFKIVSHGNNLNMKGKAAKMCLKEMWKSENVWFLEYTNIIAGSYLDRSKLHLNQKGKTFSPVILYF